MIPLVYAAVAQGTVMRSLWFVDLTVWTVTELAALAMRQPSADLTANTSIGR